MSDYLEHYVRWGLSQIVVLSHHEREVGSGYGLEVTTETVVACKGTGFVELVAEGRVSFAPGAAGRNVAKDGERSITAAEYQTRATGRPVLDTPAALAALHEAKAADQAGYVREAKLRALRAPLYTKLDELTPKCPNCDRKMMRKERRGGGAPFWSCPTYPRCNGTRNMSAEVSRILSDITNIK